mmetsp:Transcript_83382/g.131667  ORF Transcript_83382/g.131667 Transcript_83382/m.131667 type:complete len:441 (+) Transcript_83382:54-1376(+)
MFSRAFNSVSRRAPIALAAVGGAQYAAPNQFSLCDPDFSQQSSWKGAQRKQQTEDNLYTKRSEENALALRIPSKEKQEYHASQLQSCSELNGSAHQDGPEVVPVTASSVERVIPACGSSATPSRERLDYDSLSIDWGTLDDYEIVQKVGRGRYSDVFECRHVKTGVPCAMKMLKPIKDVKIKREMQILQELQGGPNIVKLLDVFKDRASKTPCLVFEYVDNADFKALYPKLSDSDIRFYVFQILQALDYCHGKGIMHRDLKPHNIMIDHDQRKLFIIDWGLSEYYHDGHNYSTRVSSRYYKAPELLINLQCYDYSLDMWSLGCILAGMVFKKEPFFRGRDNSDQLVQIARVLGTEGLFAYLESCKLQLSPEYDELLDRHAFSKKSWSKFITAENRDLACPEVLDLIDRMLVYDRRSRISPSEALQHPYFRPIREQPHCRR